MVLLDYLFISTILQARTACEAWKKEASMSKQKADMATKEKEAVIVKLNLLQKEVTNIVTITFYYGKPYKCFSLFIGIDINEVCSLVH